MAHRWRTIRSSERRRVVDFGLVRDDVRVRPGRRDEVVVPDRLTILDGGTQRGRPVFDVEIRQRPCGSSMSPHVSASSSPTLMPVVERLLEPEQRP